MDITLYHIRENRGSQVPPPIYFIFFKTAIFFRNGYFLDGRQTRFIRVFENSLLANGCSGVSHFYRPSRAQLTGFSKCKKGVLQCSTDFLRAAEKGPQCRFAAYLFLTKKV